MQRRAAAVSVTIFLLLAAGSYTLIGAAEQPEVSLDNPDYSVSVNETRTIGDTMYTFSEVTERSATATWVNESARYTAVWSNDDTVPFRDGNYTVVVANESDPSSFELREEQTVDRPTVEQNGTTYVIVEDGENRTLVPRDEYLPEQQVYEFSEGDGIEISDNDNETVVASVTESEVTIEWFAPRTNELSFGEGENTTVGDTDYLAHFAQAGGEPVVELTTDYEDYTGDEDAKEFFHERMSGLWGVVILSGAAAALLTMMAFMPSRY